MGQLTISFDLENCSFEIVIKQLRTIITQRSRMKVTKRQSEREKEREKGLETEIESDGQRK